MSGDSSSARAAIGRLAALVARAPSPTAWIQLCAELSEWPDQEVSRAIDFLRPRLSMWPPSLRTAPEWWRIAWEEGRDEPRLELAATLAGPLLPARGGGSHPVQYDVFHEDRVYYVRYRHGCLSVTLERVGMLRIDRELVDWVPGCLEEEGSWTDEETQALLSLISAAIRRDQLHALRLPRTRAALRDSPSYMRGPYPLYCQRGPCGDPEHAHDERCYDTMQAANRRLARNAARFPGAAAARHHLSLVRPGHVGPWPRHSMRAVAMSERSGPSSRCAVTVTRREQGHRDDVEFCEFLPDGRLLTGAEDGSLRVWSLDTGDSIALRGHGGPISSCARLPDGRVVSASEDGTLRVWSLRGGVCERVLEGHGCPVQQVAIAGFRVVSAGRDGVVLVWDIVTGARVQLSGEQPRFGRLVALSEQRVAGAGRGIHLWSTRGGATRTLRSPTGALLTPWFTLPDGRLIVDAETALQAWDVEAGRVTASVHAHAQDVVDCARLDDHRVVSASEDCTLRVWDVQTGRSRQLYGHEDEVELCAALGDGRVVSYSADGTLRVWDVETGACQAVHPLDVEVYSMAARDQVVVLGVESGEIVVLEIGAPESA